MRILITRHDKIGDFVLTLPMIKLAKENGHFIAVLVSGVNVEFAKNIEFIDEVIEFRGEILSLSKEIKKHKFDISISAFIDTKLGLTLFLSGIKARVGPATKIAQIFFSKRLKQRRSLVEKREFEYNIDLLKFIIPNVNTTFNKPLLEIPSSLKDRVFNEFCKKFSLKKTSKIVAFHPGFGGSSDGNLSFKNYLDLARVAYEMGVSVVFSFGPDDKKAFEWFGENLDFKAVLFTSNLSLYEFCALVTNFSLFISTSTGPMHLAGAVNTPTMSFFGNSLFASDKRWATINEKQINFNLEIQNSEKIAEVKKEQLLEIEKSLKGFINAL